MALEDIVNQSEIDAKIECVLEMLRSIEQLTRAEMLLRWQGKAEEAEAIKTQHDELLPQIERLRGQAAQSWNVGVPTIQAAIEKANLDVSASVNDIQNEVDVAQSVVKIVGQAEGALSAIKAIAHA
jgi:hypothetical protein